MVWWQWCQDDHYDGNYDANCDDDDEDANYDYDDNDDDDVNYDDDHHDDDYDANFGDDDANNNDDDENVCINQRGLLVHDTRLPERGETSAYH